MLLPVSTEDFGRVIDKKLYFVDKTLLIKDLFDDIANDKIIFTRPRRFGKTFNLSMLHYFLASEVNGKVTSGLFDSLKIAQCDGGYMQHQGKYPVVAVTFKDVKEVSFDLAKLNFAKVFSELYSEHELLLESPKLSDQNKRDFENIIRKTSSEIDLKAALKDLTIYLKKHYGVNPWVLIDEYDTPIQTAYMEGYYEELMKFMRGLLGSVLKTNPYLDKAVITGILRIAKESLFSEVNNLEVYSLLSNDYSQYFGFTAEEVENILKQENLSEKAKDIKSWYNGYQFGQTVIYNPRSIAKCIKEKGRTKSYWVNTSDNTLIKDLLKQSPIGFKQDLEKLISGESIEKLIDEQMVFHYLNNNVTSIWTLLLMSGYVKQQSVRETEQGTFVTVSVPNKEVRSLYRKIIEQWLSDGADIDSYNEFINSLLSGDIETFSKHLSNIILQITSSHDLAKEPEAFYHGLLLGFTASLHSEGNYEIKSNSESGLGRFDIILIPKDPNKLGVILELKVAANSATIKSASKKALKQINEKKYIEEIKSRGVGQVVKVGIGFFGKEFDICYACE